MTSRTRNDSWVLSDQIVLSTSEHAASCERFGDAAALAQVAPGLDGLCFHVALVIRGTFFVSKLRSIALGHGAAHEVLVPAAREEDYFCHLLGSAPSLQLAVESAVHSLLHKFVPSLNVVVSLKVPLTGLAMVLFFPLLQASLALRI